MYGSIHPTHLERGDDMTLTTNNQDDQQNILEQLGEVITIATTADLKEVQADILTKITEGHTRLILNFVEHNQAWIQPHNTDFLKSLFHFLQEQYQMQMGPEILVIDPEGYEVTALAREQRIPVDPSLEDYVGEYVQKKVTSELSGPLTNTSVDATTDRALPLFAPPSWLKDLRGRTTLVLLCLFALM